MHLNTATFPALIRQGVDAHDRCPKPLASAQHLPASMDGLSVAASVIAVVDVSVKVITLCSQYSKAVANASADISRLEKLLKGLKTTLDHAEALIKAPQGASLSTSQNLQEQLTACHSTLQKLHDKLDGGVARQTKHRLWTRALKWPFSRDEIDSMVSTLEHCHRRIMDGLLIDQTTLLLHIKSGVDGVSAMSEDVSTARQPRFFVPFPRDPDFVPRPAIQTQIHEQLAGKSSRQALFGMGGFGKSQIAIEIAYNVHDSSPEKSVFWIHGASRATLEQSYRSLADNLALPRRHDPKTNILALVCDWLQRDDVAPWLLILDNADNFDTFFSQTEDIPIASYLPKSNNGKTLITSRNLDVAERLTGGHKAIISIPAMKSDEALLLLQEKLTSSYNTATATDLIRCLDYIPLAVNQAAAYINRRRISIHEYMERFKESDKKRIGLLKHDGGDIRRHESVSNSVAITWEVTFNQIRQESPDAASLLSLLSCFQPQNIPHYMLSGYTECEQRTEDDESDDETLEKDLDVLFAYSLVKASSEPDLYEMHSLVQICTRAWLSGLGQVARWGTLFLHLAAEHFPNGLFETWNRCQLLLPHIERLLEKRPADESQGLDWGFLLTNVSQYMIEKGDYNTALDLARQSAEIREELLGPNHYNTLNSLDRLAFTYGCQGRWVEEEKLQVRVMETSKTKLGVDHLDTLSSMRNLASTYLFQGRWVKAEKLQVRLMETSKTKLGADHLDTLSSMINLAVTYGEQGRWEEAERLEVQVTEARTAKLGADHPETLSSMANLAVTYSDLGRWEEAERLQLQVIEARITKLGADHPDTLFDMNNLASIYRHQGRLEKAERLEVQVMEARTTKLGATHPLTLAGKGNLAATYTKQGRLKEAETLEVQVLESRKAKLGADHPDTLTSMNNLAFTLQRLGRLHEALELMHSCVCLRQHILGQSHPDTKFSEKAIARWQQGTE
ncbi:kinesin light chain 1 and [Beauveria bassiana ARSEF 2860]|uniref:Kinesin light chain 1 and n=1 Tax=Beauveria bassiana (strain ARSEF 2860) TaxID=655819 RepID=J5JKT6_BEAB2|nr:kinesin light chain 1 and [Beauveria bassiana ARSEF 2860]EJP63806.1 kinesin light chain 1 and [Beauveria bassiana ARSEF 2860]